MRNYPLKVDNFLSRFFMRHTLCRICYCTLLVLLIAACRTTLVPTAAEYSSDRITQSYSADSLLRVMISSYGDSVNKRMDGIIGQVATPLEKAQPEGTLGNFMADAYLQMATLRFGQPVDAAFMNYGGIRLQQLPAGPLTLGKIYELMPFDNVLVMQELSGAQLQSFLDLVASRGGWPVAGLTMQIKDRKAVSVLVKGQPLQLEKKYRIVNSDFVASGGDNAEMLKTVPATNNGYLARTALLDYVQQCTRQGRSVGALIEKRVTHGQ